jgi:hypothetical protein
MPAPGERWSDVIERSWRRSQGFLSWSLIGSPSERERQEQLEGKEKEEDLEDGRGRSRMKEDAKVGHHLDAPVGSSILLPTALHSHPALTFLTSGPGCACLIY